MPMRIDLSEPRSWWRRWQAWWRVRVVGVPPQTEIDRAVAEGDYEWAAVVHEVSQELE